MDLIVYYLKVNKFYNKEITTRETYMTNSTRPNEYHKNELKSDIIVFFQRVVLPYSNITKCYYYQTLSLYVDQSCILTQCLTKCLTSLFSSTSIKSH